MYDQQIVEINKKIDNLVTMITPILTSSVQLVGQKVEKQVEKQVEQKVEPINVKSIEIRKQYHPNGNIRSEICIDTSTGLETMPDECQYSSTLYNEEGKVIRYEWKKNGKYCSVNDRPSVVIYNPISDSVIEEKWLNKNGYLHREDNLPARIIYDENNKVKTKEFMVNGDWSPDNE
jgi:antitoxin component YwqK of YwqJK toxin-antitoxin module